ncbi:MAG TPA: hypothetical protein VL625_03225, partial [Patescibacteria group bacterium]|nr:hypothetical protein [Patescibacteria group bacterium]
MTNSTISQALKRLPSGTKANVKNLLKVFFEKTPDDDLKLLDPALMAETAKIHWDMSATRTRGVPSVRIRTIPGDSENPGLNRTVVDIV